MKPLVRRHLRWGWAALAAFLTLGLVLEALHGFKVATYLDVGNETRRLMWTLAHAHGALCGVLHLGFAFTSDRLDTPRWASLALCGGSVLLPLGFFLGGFGLRGGDPGLGIVLAPVGGLVLIAAAFGTTAAAMRS